MAAGEGLVAVVEAAEVDLADQFVGEEFDIIVVGSLYTVFLWRLDGDGLRHRLDTGYGVADAVEYRTFPSRLPVAGGETVFRAVFQRVGKTVFLKIREPFLGIRIHLVRCSFKCIRQIRRKEEFFSFFVG